MMTESNRENREDLPIGVFDSGVGGLTVVKEIMNQMPNERIVYFGDTARVPYGSKSKDTIVRYSRQIVRFLLEQNVKAIAVACNTASAYAVPEIEAECPVPVIGVIRPGAKTAVEGTKNGRIGVIGTRATISSESYTDYIRQIMPEAKVYGQACPLFVSLVEEGLWEDPVTDEIARRYMASLIDRKIDTLIMGCTHYPLIRKTIGRAVGSDVLLVNPAYETARELRKMLETRSLITKRGYELGSPVPQYRFYVSDMAGQFQRFANSIIKYGILAAEKIVMIRVYTPARWAGLEELMETALEEQRVLLTITGIQTDALGNRRETAAHYEAAYRGDGGCHSFFYTAEEEDAVLYLSPELVRMERGKSGSRPGTRMVFDPALPATTIKAQQIG